MSVSKNRSGSTEDVWGVQRYDETSFFIRGLVSLIKGAFSFLFPLMITLVLCLSLHLQTVSVSTISSVFLTVYLPVVIVYSFPPSPLS